MKRTPDTGARLCLSSADIVGERVEAVLDVERLDEEGMAFDFVAVQRALDELAARFDHGNINAMPPFDRISPITEVTVWEGPDCSATYIA